MKKTRDIIRFIDNLLTKFRKVFVNTVTFIFLTGFTLVFLFSLGSLFESDEIDTKNQILYLEPKGLIVDKAITRNDPFEDLEIFESSTNQIELKNILKVINQAGQDENLKAIYLNVDELRAYYTSALKVADALYKARENGKEIIAFTSGLGTTGYLMASQATEIILEKDSYESVLPFGFSRVRQYQRDFFKNIKVDVNVYAAGDYKSGPEGYSRNNMSKTDKLAWLEFATPVWEKYKSKMEIGREFESGTIQHIGDNYHLLATENGGDDNETALVTGLVDKLMSKQEIRNYMIEKYGSDDEYDWPEGISGAEYITTLKQEEVSMKQKEIQEKNKIAVIHVEGAIVTGNIDFNTAGSSGIVKNINKMGILGAIPDEEEAPLNILLARQHHIDNEHFEKLQPGDVITVNIIGKRFEFGDTQISVIGILEDMTDLEAPITENITMKDKKLWNVMGWVSFVFFIIE